MKDFEWTYKEINGNGYYVCGDWYVRNEIRKHNGKKNSYWYVGNDDTEYTKCYRDPFTAMEFAEKHFKRKDK